LNKDGSISEIERLPVHLSIDHRYADGILAAKMIKKIKHYFEFPEEVEKL
jgi:pyruvate/2-oxoglutarate dehydrogenase complex dihydrolipoamide acyltransferase (E2) component